MKKNFYPRLFEFERVSNPYSALSVGTISEIKRFIKEFEISEEEVKLDSNGNSEIKYREWYSNIVTNDSHNIETAHLIKPYTLSFNLITVLTNSIRSYSRRSVDKSKFPALYKTKKDNFRQNFVLPSPDIFFNFVFYKFINRGEFVRIPNDIMNKMLEIFNKTPQRYIDDKIFIGLNIDKNIQKDLLRAKPAKLMGENWGKFDYLGKEFIHQVLNDFFDTNPIIRKNWISNNYRVKYDIHNFYRDFPEVAVKYVQKFKDDGDLLISVREDPKFLKKVMGGDEEVIRFSDRDQVFLEDNRAEAHKILQKAGFAIVSSPAQVKNGNIRVRAMFESNKINRYYDNDYSDYMIYKIGTLKRNGANGVIKMDPLMTYVDMANYLIAYLNK